MAIRQFVFCDICNPRGLRDIEQRRNKSRAIREGRRISDGRSWFEGDIYDAVKSNGWAVTVEGKQICPNCRKDE